MFGSMQQAGNPEDKKNAVMRSVRGLPPDVIAGLKRDALELAAYVQKQINPAVKGVPNVLGAIGNEAKKFLDGITGAANVPSGYTP